jgi:hypothetical protein
MAGFIGRKGKMLLVVAVALTLILGVFLSMKIGYCPLVGKMKAKNSLLAYGQAQGYRTEGLVVQYDFYNSVYTGMLVDAGLLSYRLQNNTIHDENANALLNEQLREAYEKIIDHFPADLLFPEHPFVWSTVKADNYAEKAERLYLLGIYNTADLSSSASDKMPASLAADFIARLGDEYNITGIQLIYADRNGMYDIEIGADTCKPLEYEQLLAATQKRSEEKWPEGYREWRKGLG